MRRASIHILAILLLLSVCLASCIARPEEKEENEGETLTSESFTPVVDEGEDGEAAKAYAEYKENLSLAFGESERTDASSFKYETVDGGITVTEFVGTESVVVIPESIEGMPLVRIEAGAFSGKGVRAVYIPDSVLSIEKGAFADCEGLSTLRLPFVGDGGEIGYVGHIFGAEGYSQNALKLPSSLKYIIVGDSEERIEANAFAGCKDIAAIALSDSVKEIGEFAFFECNDLVCIELSGVESVGQYAFGYCESLYRISLAGVKSIGKGALASCSSLYCVELAFGESNRFLGYAFGADAADYNDEFVPESLRRVIVASGCTFIPDRAFAACKYLTEVDLPEGVTKIGVRAFYACRSLVDIDLPFSVRTVGDDAFFGCDNLASVTLADGLEGIGMQAFYGCSSLREISIPASVTEIRSSTFYGCKALERVELGGVNKIGKDAFAGCTSLTPPDTSMVIDVADGNDALFKSEMDTTEKAE